ncbi:protoheme IX farnesyltransferase, mitochondrial-like [Anneissia japonica]|uniref:protoheme IX farnesyltransferase, mitochondrial-like n=1 Tax=Anneissia japonica TaxID=1529436 RepID=UPI00142588AC|nr:protoheme IX farnesyltransferase, mitochondrial-like [Anneissia japonica]
MSYRKRNRADPIPFREDFLEHNMAAYMKFMCCGVCRQMYVSLPRIGSTQRFSIATNQLPRSKFSLRPRVRHLSSSFRKDLRKLTTKTPQLATAGAKPLKETKDTIDKNYEVNKSCDSDKIHRHLCEDEIINRKSNENDLSDRTLHKIQIPGHRLRPNEAKKEDPSVADQLVAHVVPCPIEPDDGNKQQVTELPKWVENKVQLSDLPSLYMQLSKSRLTGLVVLSAMAGYGMSSGDFVPTTFALMSLGTFFTSCSANAMNQFFEVPFDSQMLRTRNRVLVRGLLSSTHSVGFAAIAGLSGLTILGLFVNPLSAVIGITTWALYTMAYTPLKRISIVNTWVGAVVGALPPLIGWSACSGSLEAGAWVLAGILYAWQFPHFNALSWNLRKDYSRGGYRMMATTDPGLCRRVALRHCLAITGLCTLAPMIDLTTWAFALDTLPINLWFLWLSWRFYQRADSQSAKQLFRFSLLHLPLIMLLMIISKKKLNPSSTEKDTLVNWSIKMEKDVV